MKKIILYTLIIFWLGLIFYFSNQPAIQSDSVSDGVMAKIIDVVETVIDHEFTDVEIYNIYEYGIGPLRKCAHLSIYFVLGILICCLLKQYNFKDKNLIIISILQLKIERRLLT